MEFNIRLAVATTFQRHGIGRALVQCAIDFARSRGLSSITLTTFRDLPWNEPAYQRMGFVTLSDDCTDGRLAEIIEREVANGLPREWRCAMRKLID